MPTANVRDVEGLYDEIVADSDFVHEVSKRDLPYDYMKRDSHIWSCWTSRTLPVASAPWRITSASGPQAKALTKQLKSFPELQRLRLVLLEAIFRGYAGFEFEFNPPGEDCIVRDIIPIRADKITFTNEGEPRLITQDHPYEGEPMPFPKFVVVSHGERYHGHQRGMGLGQKVWWPYFMKSAGLKFWAIACERFGMPGIKAKIEGTGNVTDRRKRWTEILRDYVGGAGVVYEGEEEIDLLEANNPGMAYAKFCEFLDSEISKAMVGQTLTTEQGSRGAYSLGKVHAAVRDDIMWADTKWLDEVISRHVLKVFGTLLYGDKYKPAVFESIWENAEETIRNAERLKTLMELRPDLRKEDVYAAMGFPIPKDGEERFTWPAKPKPLAPPPSNGGDEGGRPFGQGKPLDKERKSPEDKFSEADRLRLERGNLDRVDDLSIAAALLASREFNLDRLKGRLKIKKSLARVKTREHLGSLDFSGIEQVIVETLLTAWFTGADDATRLVERKGVRFADTFAEDFGSKPVSPKEAIAWMQSRVPLPLKRLETLFEHVQTKAAFLTKDMLDVVSSRIDARMAQALETGEGMREFLKSLDDVAETAGLTASNPYYWETVFRTNVGTAYGAGREEMFEHPDVADAFGFYQYLTVDDSAVRPEHEAMHGRTWKRDDPAVQEWWPPNGYSCRCVMVPLDAEEVADEGLKVSQGLPKIDGKKVHPDKGAGYDFTGKPSKRFGIRKPRKGERAEVL